MKGKKHDANKNDYSLLPFDALEEVSKVLTFGAKKYKRDNWKTVPNSKTRYFSAGCRHLFSWFRGEVNDPETGCNHLAHAICCLLFLLSNDLNEKENVFFIKFYNDDAIREMCKKYAKKHGLKDEF